MTGSPPTARVDEQVVAYEVWRDRDPSGVSGTGLVAHVAHFPKVGRAVLVWCTGLCPSVIVYDSLDDLLRVHGHQGATRLVQVYPPVATDGGWL